jgi:thioredoxin 1
MLKESRFALRRPKRRIRMAAHVVSDDTFETDVLTATKPVLVDFWAEWCGPCKQMAPHIDALAGELSDVTIAKINVDENPMSAAKFGVRGLPTLMLFKDGKVVATQLGAISKARISEWIKENS